MFSFRIERLLGQALALFVLLSFFACNTILGNQSTTAESVLEEAGPGSGCVARTCRPEECGTLDDGCGGTIACGCGAGSVCNGSRCVCTTSACTDQQCGDIERDCGKLLRCGQQCALANHVCNGNECTCVGQQCSGRCGKQTDGCNREIDCAVCLEGETCGATVPDVCGAGGPCVPRTCVQETKLGRYCGKISNGCGTAILDCNEPCPTGQTCGGGGAPNVCGCTPKSCAQLGAECGTVPNNCQGQPPIDCGSSCPGASTCGGGGIDYQCGCTPQTCTSLGATCGTPSDGCGNPLPSCGTCPSKEVCNSDFRCAAACTPLTREQACTTSTCGIVPDNCGGEHDCGGCTEANEVCEGTACVCAGGNPRCNRVCCAANQLCNTFRTCGLPLPE